MTNPWARWLSTNDSARYQLSRKQGWNAFVSSGPRDDFEVISRQQMDALPADQLEDYNEARMVWNANLPTVKTAQLKAAYGVIDQVMASNRRDSDRLRGSVVIDAEPGLGKTTIATATRETFTRRCIDVMARRPPRAISAYRLRSFLSARVSPSRVSISRSCASTGTPPSTEHPRPSSGLWRSIASPAANPADRH